MSEEQNPLSEREMDLVRLLATGATNQQIAQELVISVNTVKVHLRNIYAKLGVASRTEATMMAVRQGWVDVSTPEEEAEEAQKSAEDQPQAQVPPALPSLERWPPVSMIKRIGFVVAGLLALVIVFLPLAIRSGTNGQGTDPIEKVFPTVPTNSTAERWRTRAQMPTPRTDLAVAAHGRQIYAIGGVSNDGVTARVEVYDPSTEAWEPRQSKPTPSGFVSAAVVGDKIYVPGGIGAGVQPLDVLEVYDPLEDTWETLEPMPEPLGGYGLAVLDDQIYLFGGRGTQGYVSTVYRYDPATGEWATMQPMEQAKGLLGAAALGDRIYVVGGYDDVSEFDACNIYDPSSDSWTTCPSMERPRGGLALVTVRDKLYAIGGGMTSYLAYNEVYDSKVGTWRRIATPVNEEWRGLGATLVNNFVHTIGGWSGGNLSVNEAYKAIYVVVVP